MFADLFDVAMTALLDVCRFVQHIDDRLPFVWLSWLGARTIFPEDAIIRVILYDDLMFRLDRLVGQSWGFLRDLILAYLRDWASNYYLVPYLLDEKYLTQWSNITVKYAIVGFS